MNMKSLENSIKKTKNENKTKDWDFEILKRFSHKIEDEHIESILECLDRSLKNAEKIGAGMNAEVFKLEAPWSSVCVKVFKQQREIINEFDIEFEFQETVNNLNIFTPESLISVKNNNTNQQYLIMECIDGLSLQDLLNGKNNEMRDELIKNAASFFEELKNNINTMHANNIHHRDLHMGNVMFDFSTKKPVIIDFGHATRVLSDDSDREIYIGDKYRINEQTGRKVPVKVSFLKDNEKVKELKNYFT